MGGILCTLGFPCCKALLQDEILSQLICITILLKGSIHKLISGHNNNMQGHFDRTGGESFRLTHTHIADIVIYPSAKTCWPLKPFQHRQIHHIWGPPDQLSLHFSRKLPIHRCGCCPAEYFTLITILPEWPQPQPISHRWCSQTAAAWEVVRGHMMNTSLQTHFKKNGTLRKLKL